MSEAKRIVAESILENFEAMSSHVVRQSLKDMIDENTRLTQQVKDLEEVLADKRRLTREIDVALNGEHGAAKQASLCDILSQLKALKWNALDGGKGVQGG